jgi:hypothetical protein
MSWLDDITPLNYLEEKAKFLADASYNPQFIYRDSFDPATMETNGLPQKDLVDLAQAIVDKTYFGRNEVDLLLNEGPKISTAEVTKKFETFLSMHGLEKRFEIIWSTSFVARATCTKDAIKLRSSADFHKQELLGLIYHEVGTHALRTVNYEQQPWYRKKKAYGFQSHLMTEEGLAVLNSLVPRNIKSVHNAAIRYLGVEYAQHHSLAEVWRFLGTYIQDPETRWMVAFRLKRGLTDTAQPGGSTKDLVYFAGCLQVWHWLKAHDFDITPLYFGKIAIENISEALALNPDFQPLLPSFFTLDRAEYSAAMQAIGTWNLFDQIKK